MQDGVTGAADEVNADQVVGVKNPLDHLPTAAGDEAVKSSTGQLLAAHADAGKLDQLCEAYSRYWETVGLSQALVATMAVLVVDFNVDESTDSSLTLLTHIFVGSFGLAFIVSSFGVGLCAVLIVQFGFALVRPFAQPLIGWLSTLTCNGTLTAVTKSLRVLVLLG